MLNDLTVVIACKDRNKNLEYCLNSIAASKNPPKETIVVDFGSVEPLRTTLPAVRIIRTTNNTQMFHKSRALNIGIKSVTTKYTCITDADQTFQDNFFFELNNKLDRDKKAFVMCQTYFLRNIPDYIVPNNFMLNYWLMLAVAKESGGKPHGEGCCNGVRTQWLMSVKGYDEQFIGFGAEDSDVMFRAHRDNLNRTGLNSKTSMIHLPHDKTGSYYDIRRFDKNRTLFKQKNKSKTIVNSQPSWGVL